MAGLVSVDHSGFSVSFNEYLRYLSESLGTLKTVDSYRSGEKKSLLDRLILTGLKM
jgi:hypothetical protein